jgi:hypothetical protein
VIVCFVDIGGINYHHCLKFLVVIMKILTCIWILIHIIFVDMETNLSVATDTNPSADMDTDIEDLQG